MVLFISYRVCFVFSTPLCTIFFCKFTFPLVNFHLCIYQTKKKSSVFVHFQKAAMYYDIIFVSIQKMNAVKFSLSYRIPTEMQEKYIIALTKTWLDPWKIGLKYDIRKDWAYTCKTFGCFALSNINFLFFIIFIFFITQGCGIFVSPIKAIDLYLNGCFFAHAWEALNRPKIQLWNGFTSIRQNENWLLDGSRMWNTATHTQCR